MRDNSLKSLLKLQNNNQPMINRLKEDISKGMSVVMWGAGSMSASTRKMLAQEGVSIDAIWVDGKKEGPIGEVPICSYREIVDRYGRFDVVCGHSRYDLVEAALHEHLEINNIFCFVNICYGQWKGIEKDFIEEHMADYAKSFDLLEDGLSKECLAAYLNCRNNEDYHYLLECCRETATYFDNPFFSVGENEVYLDVGAYDGDSIRSFIEALGNKKYKKIIAIEPEEKSRERLKKYISTLEDSNISIYENGCWNEDAILRFNLAEESSGIGDSGVQLSVKRIDEQFKGERISLIKINFLPGITETIEGAKKVLKEDKPNLAITVGFDEWGIIKIPQIIKSINPSYRLGLRYASPMPARLVLYGY